MKITSQDIPVGLLKLILFVSHLFAKLYATIQGTAHSVDSDLDESHKKTADFVPVDAARSTGFDRDISPARNNGSLEVS